METYYTWAAQDILWGILIGVIVLILLPVYEKGRRRKS